MRVRDAVQQIFREGTINGGHEDVTVQDGPVGDRILDRPRMSANVKAGRSRPAVEMFRHQFYLGGSNVLLRGIQQAVEVVRFDIVRIDEHDVFDAHSRQRLSHHAADAADTDDADAETRQVALPRFAPCVDGTAQRRLPWRRRHLSIVEGDLQPPTGDSYLVAPRAVEAAAIPHPETCAPTAVGPQRQSDQRQAGRANGWGDAIPFSSHIRSTHVLPAIGQVVVHEG